MLHMDKLRKIILLFILLTGGCVGKSGVGYTDENGPYINIRQYEFTTEVGNPIDFSNITGYDDYDGLLKTSVRGQIDYTQEGDYYPQIICTDLSGNMTVVPITVHVVKSLPQPSDLPSQSPLPTPITENCARKNAVDPDIACDIVPPEHAETYEILYIGEAGESACHQDMELGKGTSCEVVTTNDGHFWGYGLKKETPEAAEKN